MIERAGTLRCAGGGAGRLRLRKAAHERFPEESLKAEATGKGVRGFEEK
jgi:hypothetical protein